MDKKELQFTIKNFKDLAKIKEISPDDRLFIITKNQFIVLSQDLEEEVFPKIKINEIEVAIFYGSDARGLYLKNGLQSYREAHKNKMV